MGSGHTMPTNAIINSIVTGKWLFYIFKKFKGSETNLLYQRPEGHPFFLRGNVWEEERRWFGFAHNISYLLDDGLMWTFCQTEMRQSDTELFVNFCLTHFKKEFESQGTTAGVSPGALPSELPSHMHSSKMYLVQ